MENVYVIGRLSRGHNGNEKHDSRHVAAEAVVFVDGFGVVDAAVQGREVKLGEANQGLQKHQDVGGKADDGVGGFKVGAMVAGLVVVDDNEAGEESEKASPIENAVDVSAESLLLGSVGGLDDQYGQRDEEDPGGVGKL